MINKHSKRVVWIDLFLLIRLFVLRLFFLEHVVGVSYHFKVIWFSLIVWVVHDILSFCFVLGLFGVFRSSLWREVLNIFVGIFIAVQDFLVGGIDRLWGLYVVRNLTGFFRGRCQRFWWRFTWAWALRTTLWVMAWFVNCWVIGVNLRRRKRRWCYFVIWFHLFSLLWVGKQFVFLRLNFLNMTLSWLCRFLNTTLPGLSVWF